MCSSNARCLIQLFSCIILCSPVYGAHNFVTANQQATVPMKILYTGEIGGLPLVQIQVGSHSGWWMLDTAATDNIVSQTLVNQLQLQSSGNKQVATIGGIKNAPVYQLESMKIGNVVFEKQSVLALDLSLLEPSVSESLSGILGVAALQELAIKLDMPRKMVTFSEAGLAASKSSGQTVPLTMKYSLPFIPVGFAGISSWNFLLDTGNAGALVAFPSEVLQDKLDYEHKAMKVVVDELGGAVTTRLIGLPEFKVNGFTATNVPVSIPQTGADGFAAHGVDGSVGNAFFMNSVIEINIPKRSFNITPATGQYNIPGGFGFILSGNTNQVATVFPGSTANANGLQAGDNIIAVNGQTISTASALWERLTRANQARLSVERSGKRMEVPVSRSYFFPQ